MSKKFGAGDTWRIPKWDKCVPLLMAAEIFDSIKHHKTREILCK
jgi:hypothetical protein